MADIPELPKKSAADLSYGITKAVVSAIPVGGGAAAEIMGIVFGSPLERRREEWFKRLAELVNEIQEHVAELTPEKLSENEAFVSTAIHASQIALRTHQQEKLDALRNAVINSPQT